MARKARDFSGDVIAFCGVWFMAETAKVLNPNASLWFGSRRQLQPVESCRADDVRAYRSANPDHVIVSYINTSVEVKRGDILCTAQCRADRQFHSADKTVLFLPDINLATTSSAKPGART